MSTHCPPKTYSPASKLYHDVLYEIFSANVDWVETKKQYDSSLRPVWDSSSVLHSTRYASQVCRAWRETLLDSPSIWAKCIHLDLLDQEQDHWRNLVMQRTKTSLLSIMGGTHTHIVARDSVGSKLLSRLFEEDYWRIRHFAVRMQPTFLDSSQTWKALNRPWVSLREFTLEVVFSMPDGRALNVPPDIQLFGNLAPSLAVLSLPLYISLVPVSINMPPRNMRILDLIHQPLEVNNLDLIRACRHMSYLETLRLQISILTVNDSKESKYNNKSVYLPFLNTMTIDASTLNIFPAFLDHIFPMTPCTLRSTISNTYTTLDSSPISDSMMELTGAMARVVKRFAASWTIDTRGTAQYSLQEMNHIHVLPRSFRVESCIPHCQSKAALLHKRRNTVALSYNGGIALWMFQYLIDSVSFDNPMAFTGLHLYTPNNDMDGLFERPSMAHSLAALCGVTELTISPALLPYLNWVAGEEDIVFFPRLKTLSVTINAEAMGDTTSADEEKEQIELFLGGRHYTTWVDRSRYPPCRTYSITTI